MNTLALAALVCVVSTVGALPYGNSDSQFSYPFTFVTRNEWGARPARYTTVIEGPVPFVLIHHSYIPGPCFTRDYCKEHMVTMQDMHQIDNRWEDIGYNFAVGGDGAVYEGRGWGLVGAHASGWNLNSLGIVFIGDFVSTNPPVEQIATAKKLIDIGLQLGYISPNYRLLGHRQVGATECPGGALFREIQNWERFSTLE